MFKARVSPAMAVTLLCVLAMAAFVASAGVGDKASKAIPASEAASKVAKLASNSRLTADAVSQALAAAEQAIADLEAISEVLALADKVMEDPGPMNLVREVMLAAEAAATADSGVLDSLEDAVSSSGAATLLDNVVPAPDSAPALVTTYEDFDFGLDLDLGADVRAAGGPEDTQGAINFTIGSVNTITTCVPGQDSSLLPMVSGTYDVLQSN